MNVLITAAGRRTALVNAFAQATHRLGGRTFASDVDPLAPALFLADEAFRVSRTDNATHLAELLDVVAHHGVGLLVPTIDTDLPVLATNRASFTDVGCRVLVSDPSFVDTTLDKAETGRAFGSAGVRVPRWWLPPIDPTVELPEQLFVKPRRGSASQHTYASGRDDLEWVLRLVPDPIVQEFLEGPEITIDALLDFEGSSIHYVPRRRIRTLAGESVQGVTLERDAQLERWIEHVLDQCAAWGAVGPLTLQAFLTADGPVLSEINPRFGGGFPLALAAGAAYPTWLLEMAAGQVVAPRLGAYEAGLYMTRYQVEHFTRSPKW